MQNYSLASIHYDRVVDTIKNPSRWCCDVCERTVALWICLVCGSCYCRDPPKLKSGTKRIKTGSKTHFEEHFTSTRHSIFIELNRKDHNVYCCYTKSNITTDNKRNDVFLLRTVLRQVQEFEADTRTTRTMAAMKARKKWKVVGLVGKFTIRLNYVLPKAIAKRHHEDSVFTALYKWKHALLVKSFNSWKNARRLRLGLNRQDFQRRPSLFPGKTGLRNLGNTCYINSVMQSLCQIDAFQAYILNKYKGERIHEDNTSLESTLHKQFALVFRNLVSGKLAVYSPDKLLESIWHYFPSFAGFKQQDAEELLRCVIVQLDEEQAKVDNFLESHFSGRICYETSCKSCKHSSVVTDAFTGGLQIEIPEKYQHNQRYAKNKSCDLLDCLSSLIRKEEIAGYRCSNCSKQTDATRQSYLAKLPKILILHIQRADWKDYTKKIQTHINFNENLDMSSYCRTDSSMKSARNSSNYKLCSIIVHDGGSMEEGHYTAYGKSREIDSWLYFNDHRVSRATNARIEKIQGNCVKSIVST